MIYLPIRSTRAMLADAAVFFLGGDLLAAGYAPYLRLWDVKPPQIYNTTALLAVIAPNDPWTQFYLGSILTGLAAVAIVALAGGLTYRVTDRASAAFITAMLIIGFHNFVRLPSRGILPRYFALAFGLAGLWFSLNNRWALASGLATVAAGYWQWALIFVLLVYGRAWRESNTTNWRRMMLASALVTIVTVLPVVFAGGGIPMAVEVVIDVFRLGDHGQTTIDRIRKFIQLTGFLWPLLIAGVVGAFEVVYRKRSQYWLAFGVAWPVIQLGIFDFDSAGDLHLLFVFAAIGLGVTLGTLRLARHQQVAIVCCVLILTGGQLYDQRHRISTPAENSVEPNAAGVEGAFIGQRIPPESCAISMGAKMERLYADRPDKQYCGTQIPIG